MKSPVPLKPSDSLPISEIAEALNLPASALITAIEKSRVSITKPFYSIPDLSKRWNCSRATVYNILKDSEYKLLSLTRKDRSRGKQNVAASIVERIEMARMEPFSPKIAA